MITLVICLCWTYYNGTCKDLKANLPNIILDTDYFDKYINTFQPAGGGFIRFLNFEALTAIFELGIQPIWIKNSSILIKTLYAQN